MNKEKLRAYVQGMEPHKLGMLVWDFTHRTTNIEDLHESEINAMCNFFRSLKKTPEEIYREAFKVKEWRSNVLSLATDIGIKEATSWVKFNNFMLSHSKFKKPLNQHNVEELQILYRQLKSLQKNNEKSAQSIMTKEWFRKGLDLKEFN